MRLLKVGDLVKCLFQPRSSRVQHGICLPMPHTIKGELGIVVKSRNNGCQRVLFPQFGYEHDLTNSVLEKIND